MVLKVLICGDVRGNFRILFDRVAKLNKKKGPFDFMLAVGDFFGTSHSNWEPYRTNALTVPIMTYILGPTNDKNLEFYSDPAGCELCPNLYHLGKRGVLTSNDLRIAYVSGVADGKNDELRISKNDVQSVRDIAYKGKSPSEYMGIDVLITSEWPKNVTDLVENVDENARKAAYEGSELLAWLAMELKPRYHFAGLRDIFFERPPYRNRQLDAFRSTHHTRFIALSSLSGKKWLYGAELTPIAQIKKDELYQRTSDETECPYKESQAPQSEQYFFDMTSKDRPRGVKRKRRDDSQSGDLQKNCWFCLAGGQDAQTVITIGTTAYVALPKGGLTRRHLLVCPVDHLKSSLHLPRTVREEISEIKKSIVKYFRKSHEVSVFFERYYRTSHMQLNAVPVPEKSAARLNSVLSHCAENHMLELVEMEEGDKLEDVMDIDKPFLHIELPDGSQFFIRCGSNFPLHFARIVLSNKEILNAGDKIEWKDCVLPQEEEQNLVKELREEFSEFYSGD